MSLLYRCFPLFFPWYCQYDGCKWGVRILLLGPKEVGVILGLHPKTVIRMFRRYEIPAFRPGGKLWRTSREAVDEYIALQLRLARESRIASLCTELPRVASAVSVTQRAKF